MRTIENIIGTIKVIGFVLAVVILGFAIGFVIGKHRAITNTSIEVRVDTVYRIKPLPYKVTERVQTLSVPRILFVPADTIVREVFVPIGDKDSVKVQATVEAREYKDSTYRAVVSGVVLGDIHPSLDFIETYNTTITKTIQKRPKFAFTAGVGYGYTPKGFQPYAGVNFGIILWSF